MSTEKYHKTVWDRTSDLPISSTDLNHCPAAVPSPIEYVMKLKGEDADFLKSHLAMIMPVVSIRIWRVNPPF
jgi:hypothetical protein